MSRWYLIFETTISQQSFEIEKLSYCNIYLKEETEAGNVLSDLRTGWKISNYDQTTSFYIFTANSLLETDFAQIIPVVN